MSTDDDFSPMLREATDRPSHIQEEVPVPTARPPFGAYATAAIVVFNMIVGSGVLAVPKAVYGAGWALSILLLIIVAAVSYTSLVWLYECQLRAQALNAAFVAGCIRVVPFRKSTGMEGLADDLLAEEDASPVWPTRSPATSDGKSMSTAVDATHSAGYKPSPAESDYLMPRKNKTRSQGALTVGPALAAMADQRQQAPSSQPSSPVAPSRLNTPVLPSRFMSTSIASLEERGRSLGYGLCLVPANSVVDLVQTPMTRTAVGLPKNASGAFGMFPSSVELPVEVDLTPSTGVTPRSGHTSPAPQTPLLRESFHVGCATIVFDPNHATEERKAAPETTMPFVLAVKAQQAHNWYGLYDVERASTEEEINAAVDYEALDNSGQDYLEQDYLASVCGGKPVALAANISLSLMLLATAWLYFVVLAQTAVLTVPIPGYTSFLQCNMHDEAAFERQPHCGHAMRIFIVVFTALLLLALARNWKIIDAFQRLVTVVTYSALAIMVISCAVGMGKEPFDPQVSTDRIQHIPAFNFEGFPALFGVAALCLTCHPGSTLMLRKMPTRKDTTKVYGFAFMSVLLMYITVGVVVAFYMGDALSSVMNLNWIDFGKTWGGRDSTPLRVLGIVVVMFPLFSVSACCALYCRALAESVEAYLPAAWLYRLAGALGREYRGAGLDLFPVGNVLRVCVVLIPATCALITFKFDKAMAVAGFFAFFIVFFVPGAMQLYSRRVVRRLGLRPSPHETVLGHDSIVLFVMSVCTLAAAYYVWKQMIPALE